MSLARMDNAKGDRRFAKYVLAKYTLRWFVKMQKANNARIQGPVTRNFHEFCDNTSMHGFKFITRKESTWLDSILWTLLLSGSVAFTMIFSNILWEQWNISPVIITIESADCPIGQDYPFPAVTVCSVNKVSKRALADFLQSDEGKGLNMDDIRSALEIITLTQGDSKEIARLGKLLLEANITTSNQGYENLVRKVSPNCSEMFVWCNWEGQDEDCNRMFETEPTDNGYCCSFNSIIFDKNASSAPNYKKLRYSRGDGVKTGLRVILDAEIDDYNVTSSSFTGFRVSIQSPDTFPKTGRVGFLVSPGSAVDAAIDGMAIKTHPDVRAIPPHKRNCAITADRLVDYFRDQNYTSAYCEMACQIERFLKYCQCVPYHFPGLQVPVCPLSSYSCLKQQHKEFISNLAECRCLDACDDVWYQSQITQGVYPNRVQGYANSLDKIPKLAVMNQDERTEYGRQNLVKFNVYFKNYNGMCYIREPRTTWSNFISATGGLLGLGFGFSLLSAVEVLYYISVRWHYYRTQLKKREQQFRSNVVVLDPRSLSRIRSSTVPVNTG